MTFFLQNPDEKDLKECTKEEFFRGFCGIEPPPWEINEEKLQKTWSYCNEQLKKREQIEET
jgi:hypothetical protein